jgi:hypothetical protein
MPNSSDSVQRDMEHGAGVQGLDGAGPLAQLHLALDVAGRVQPVQGLDGAGPLAQRGPERGRRQTQARSWCATPLRGGGEIAVASSRGGARALASKLRYVQHVTLASITPEDLRPASCSPRRGTSRSRTSSVARRAVGWLPWALAALCGCKRDAPISADPPEASVPAAAPLGSVLHSVPGASAASKQGLTWSITAAPPTLKMKERDSFEFTITAHNGGRETIDTRRDELRLLVDGKPSFGFMLNWGNGHRSRQWKALPTGEQVHDLLRSRLFPGPSQVLNEGG